MALADIWVLRTRRPIRADLPGTEMDILAYLEGQPQQQAPLRKLGMDLKDPEILSEVYSLAQKGYVLLLEPKSTWKCIVCGALNASARSDPRQVQCVVCNSVFTVTGRHVDGSLIVQKFAMR
ncbi:MAG: hypothetical protein QW212_00840 [Nitrososphaerales archaeon]